MATAALIATDEGSRPALVNRLLAWRPLVFVGLISYSLYLWQPAGTTDPVSELSR
jgi:peptidoglycan/LPS O-acetylase OafA/YrhL